MINLRACQSFIGTKELVVNLNILLQIIQFRIELARGD